MTRLALALLLAASTLIGTSGSTVSAASPDSEIPGVPLPGTVTVGNLGGQIYDVVYSVMVPAGSVLVAGLTGSYGTDFDLYLFPPSATTVTSTVGVLAKSTGPTSTENLSWATKVDTTVYLDLNGASDVPGSFVLTVQIVPDPSPPSLRLATKDGITRTGSTDLVLQLNAFDDLSGIAEMSFSADGEVWLPWEEYSQTKTWNILPVEGTQFVYARVKNGAGATSNVASTSVFFDATPPRVVRRDPAPDATIGNVRPRFTVTFDEPMAPTSWLDLGLVIQDQEGTILQGSYTFDQATLTGSFTPDRDLVIGDSYIVTIGTVTDIAGNKIAPVGSWTVKALRPSSISLGSSVKALTYGGSVKLTGRVAIPDGGTARLEMKRESDADFTPVPDVAPVSGALSVTLKPRVSTQYRLRYAGSDTVAQASAGLTVAVRRSVTLAGRSTGKTASTRAGRSVTLTAKTTPSAAGASASFRLLRYSTATKRYTLYRAFARTVGSTGTATYRWKAVAGRWAWEIRIAPYRGLATSTSGRYRWSVTR